MNIFLNSLGLSAILVMSSVNNCSQDKEYSIENVDSAKIAFCSDRDGDFDIYTMNFDGTNVKNLTSSENKDWAPSWSPDGSMISFSSDRDGNVEIYTIN